MTWTNMKKAFNELESTAKSNKNKILIKWEKFQKIAIEVSHSPPMALDNLTSSLYKISKGKKI